MCVDLGSAGEPGSTEVGISSTMPGADFDSMVERERERESVCCCCFARLSILIGTPLDQNWIGSVHYIPYHSKHFVKTRKNTLSSSMMNFLRWSGIPIFFCRRWLYCNKSIPLCNQNFFSCSSTPAVSGLFEWHNCCLLAAFSLCSHFDLHRFSLLVGLV
jgi:hypothetical protein